MRLFLKCLCLIGLALLWPSAAEAGIVYVDAVAKGNAAPANPNGNTTLNGALITAADVTTDSGSNDSKWWLRSTGVTGFNGDYLWETDGNGTPASENTAPLVTTFELPDGPGIYNLYGFFWSSATGLFDVEFRVGASGSFTAFSVGLANATVATTELFETPTPSVTGTWSLAIANLGQFTFDEDDLDGNGDLFVQIYVNGPDRSGVSVNGMGQITNGQRTAYEGVGYQLVPEPSAMLLAGCGLLGLTGLRLRRRK